MKFLKGYLTLTFLHSTLTHIHTHCYTIHIRLKSSSSSFSSKSFRGRQQHQKLLQIPEAKLWYTWPTQQQSSFVLKWEPAACRCVQYGVWQQVLAITIVVVRESRQFPQSDYFYTTTTQPRENTITINLGLRAPLSSTLLLRLQPCLLCCWFSFNLQQLCSSSFQRCTVADCNRGGL